VNQRALADLARRIGLDRFVKLGRTEQRTAGERKNSVLANCLEAVVGAIYLDPGLATVTDWVARVFGEAVTSAAVPPRRDAKTLFQEWTHARFRTTPTYRTVEDSGRDGDDERFRVEVLVGKEVWGSGSGRSKQTAESRAAGEAAERAFALDAERESDG